jgi:hypothetical protein
MKNPSLTDKELTQSRPVATKKGKPRQPMVGYADAALHQKLRELLADHSARTYGDLRRQHNLSPIDLEKQISRYPAIFESGVELTTGRPTIKLRAGPLDSREDILMRETLVKKVRGAGATGIRLLRLYMSSRIDSKTVQRLLNGVPDIAVSTAANSKGHRSDLLYKWTGQQSRVKDSTSADPEPVAESSSATPELETARQKLVVLCERTHRHFSWLSEFMDPALIRRVLERWPEDFEVEPTDLGGPPDLIIRNKFSPAAILPPATNGHAHPLAPQEVSGPDLLLEEILDPQVLAELRWKPSSPDMCRRRNRPAAWRGDRVLRDR